MTTTAPALGTWSAGLWPRIARWVVRAVLAALFRIRLEGTPPAKGPYLLIADHQGWADAFLIVALFPLEPRIHFIADRAATMTVWWKRSVLCSLGVLVPVSRDGGSERAAIATALELLGQGDVVAIFPEGEVSRAELGPSAECGERGRAIGLAGDEAAHRRELAPFKRGVGYLALKAGVTVVPVWLQGTAELYVGRELTARVGVPISATGPWTKAATIELVALLHRELSHLARPWTEPEGVTKRWRWLTHLF